MPVVAVFGASTTVPDTPQYDDGVRCGRLLAEAGFAVATGGYGGLMEAVSLGAGRAGGRVIGVTAPSVFPQRTGGNPHLTEETRAESLLTRIEELAHRTDAVIALPGSLGTATELLAAWNLAFVTRFGASEPKPIFAVVEPWSTLVPVLTDVLDTDGGLVTLVPTVDDAVTEMTGRFQQ